MTLEFCVSHILSSKRGSKISTWRGHKLVKWLLLPIVKLKNCFIMSYRHSRILVVVLQLTHIPKLCMCGPENLLCNVLGSVQVSYKQVFPNSGPPQKCLYCIHNINIFCHILDPPPPPKRAYTLLYLNSKVFDFKRLQKKNTSCEL